MKYENLIRGIGEMDDRILERYHAIDVRLSHKHARKAIVVRALAIAACVAILVCATVPMGLLSHPAGRAVLRGDYEGLNEELCKIEGFTDWQAETAEKLERFLPQEAYGLLQTTPIVNVLTQPQFAGLEAQDMFVDGKPYHLYFISNGDGTCTLQYITADPMYAQNYVIEIPETSPAGDTVTAIDIQQSVRGMNAKQDDFPYVLTADTMHTLLATAKDNNISDFDYNRLTAHYLKLSLDVALEENQRSELLGAFPITILGDIYVFDGKASETDCNKTYEYLTTYCEWDSEKYEQSMAELVRLVKKSGRRDIAELCLTAVRNSDLSGAVGITIPKTVTSINSAMWASLPALEDVTVDAEHPTLKMIDGCLVDTSTGTLALYLREDGTFPEGLDLRILGSYAFAACAPLPVEADGAPSLQIPEGVTEIKKDCFAGISFTTAPTGYIYLPASLGTFSATYRSNGSELIYCYPGTLEEWSKNVTFVQVSKKDCIYLLTSDAEQPMVFYFFE